MRIPALVIAATLAVAPIAAQAAAPMPIPAPVAEATPPASGLETTVLAGGCFWGIQAVFQHVKGVTNAVSGYAGGARKDADYETVSSGATGHAESVKVTFEPRVVSFGKILQVYFAVAHDPTQLNRQGPDSGTQYRSEIFPQSDEQRMIAKAYIAQLDAAQVFPGKIVTKVDAEKAVFFPAESYHQDYAIHHPYQPYIVFNDAPKVKMLKAQFPDLWRDKPVTVAEAMKSN